MDTPRPRYQKYVPAAERRAAPKDNEALTLLREIRDGLDDIGETIATQEQETRYRIRDLTSRVGVLSLALAIVLGGTYIDGAFWRHQLEVCRQLADGVVVWNWDTTNSVRDLSRMAWFSETRDFIRTL